jgi:CPA2 family monovalent cation:H+ antiporter-2
MNSDAVFYRDLAYVFVAAVLGGIVANRLRQPTIIGYVLAGIFIGPFTPGPTVGDLPALELLAEIGVVLLMYSIGIEFSPRDLLAVGSVAILGAPLGIALSVAMGILAAYFLGWTVPQGVAIGAIISVASTMVLSRLLLDRNALQSLHGRIMISITLIEDLAVVFFTVLMPSLNNLSGGRFLFLAFLIGKALLILVPVAFIAAKVVPRLMEFVAKTGSEELFILVAVALGFATAELSHHLGLSLALGAFLAGAVISGSEYSHRTLAHLLPLREVFVALFFVTMGALIDPKTLWSNPGWLAVMVLLIVAGKFAIWTGVVSLFRYPLRTAVLVGAGLTQIGEFSYVLVQVSRKAGIVNEAFYNITLASSLLTILLNALSFRLVPAFFRPDQQH